MNETVEFREPSENSPFGWFVSEQGVSRYLHSDGVIRSSTDHNGIALGYYPTRERALEAIRKYKGEDMRTQALGKWWLDLKEGDIITCIKDDMGISHGVTKGEVITVQSVSSDNDYLDTGYIFAYTDKGGTIARAVFLSDGNFIKTKLFNEDIYAQISMDEAQILFDEVGGVNANLLVNRNLEYLHEVSGLQPIGWSNPNNFWVKWDSVLQGKPKPKRNGAKRLYIHNDLYMKVGVFDGATYYGNQLYYFEGVKNTFNSSSEYPITTNDEGEIICRGNKLKLGRIIRQVKESLSDLEIESIVSGFKTKYEIDTSKVKTSTNIASIYNQDCVGGSCMANQPNNWFDIYVDMGSSMAYLEDGNGGLSARALVHHVVGRDSGKEYTIMDRVFYDTEVAKLTLQKWRREQDGYERFKNIEEKLIGANPIDDEYENVPYVDNLCYVTRMNGENYLSTDNNDYFDTLQETTGGSNRGEIAGHGEDMVYCQDIEEYVHIDDAYYCDGDESYYGSSDYLVYISSHGYYHEDDENIARDESTGEYDFRDNLKYIEDEDTYTSSDDYYVCDEDGEYYHIDKLVMTDDGYTVQIEHATYIEDDGIYVYHTDDYFEHDDGKWYSYEEEQDEDDEDEVA